MALNYRELITKLSPGWLRGYWGTRFMGVLALCFDEVAQAATNAIAQAWPSAVFSTDDALSPLGNERGLLRYSVDTADTYRARILDAWNIWDHAGSWVSINRQLEAYGITGAEVKRPRDGWCYEWPSDTDNWSRFTLIITPGNYANAGELGAEEAADLLAIARKWKSAHEVCVDMVVIFDGIVCGWPPAACGGGYVCGASSSARYS